MMAKEWILCGMSYIYAFVRDPANTPAAVPKRVLVWQMAKLGDMVCTTPMFRALKQSYPGIRVTVIGNAINKQVLEGNTDVDEYIVFEGFLQTVKSIRQDKYDASFITGPSAISIATLFLGDVRCIAAPKIENGISPYETNAYRLLLKLVIRTPHRMGHYAPREYLQLLESVGIHTDDTRKYLSYSDEARKKVETFLREYSLEEKKFVVISPSAGNKIKRWPADRFARVAEHLVQKGYPVVIIGGSRDREEVADMMHAIEKSEGITNALEEFSIDELKAFIAQAALFVAVDTGPIYIAEAFGVPTVDIVGSMDEREQPPIGPKNIIVVPSGPRVPALHIMNARQYDEKEARKQTDSITVDMVFNSCEKLLK